MDAATIHLNAIWVYDSFRKNITIRIPHAEYAYLCYMTQEIEDIQPDIDGYIQLNHDAFRALITETVVAEWRQAINNK